MSASRLLAGCLLVALLPADSSAQSRHVRRFGEESGVIPPVWAIGQDHQGFLWIGAQGGLYRFDGATFQRIASEQIRGAVIALAFHPRRGVAAITDRGELFEARAGATLPIYALGPPGPRRLDMLAYDRRGALWMIRGRTVHAHRLDGSWHSLPPACLEDERPLMVSDEPGGGVLITTDAAIWRVGGDATCERVLTGTHIVDVMHGRDGVATLDLGGRLADARGERLLPAAAPALRGARAIAMVQRGRMTWVAFDRYLVAQRENGALEVLAPEDGIEGGGPLLVDREGSLWVGTFTSLLQFPEPETRIWTDRHGLPSTHVRFIARTGSVLWVSGWQGAARIDRAGADVSVRPVRDWFTQQRLCRMPARNSVWSSSNRGFLELTADGARQAHPALAQILGCAPAPDGLWLATREGLFRVDREGVVARVTTPGEADSPGAWQAVLEDSRGELWLARAGEICRWQRKQPDSWRCDSTGDSGGITVLVEVPGGAVWAGSEHAGILHATGNGWAPVTAGLELPTATIFDIAHARSGGVWLLGHGVVQRVVPEGESWRVVERLGAWHGLPVSGGQNIVEDEHGALWITTSLGVVEVPPAARFAAAAAPPVALVDADIDGQPRSLAELLAVPFRQNRVELRFAALSYRDPGRLRYQLRVGSEEWRESHGAPSFRWFDLRPGTYDVAVRASLDGRTWSETPAAVRFRVLTPWYLQPLVLAGFALLALVLTWAAYRARVHMLLRLERQRTRIATDLHDEIGSGLGSIGILAGVLSKPANGQHPPSRRRQLAREIAQTSEQLGVALSDIVWALDPQTVSLHELAARLTEHGNRLCTDDDGPEFEADLPAEWPRDRLSATVRRNVLSIGLEALHNAVRHAGATRVALMLRPHERGWELVIEDDGTGIPGERESDNGAASDSPRHREARNGGRGLVGMRRRAAELGADLVVQSAATGTRITLRFRLAAREDARRRFSFRTPT